MDKYPVQFLFGQVQFITEESWMSRPDIYVNKFCDTNVRIWINVFSGL